MTPSARDHAKEAGIAIVRGGASPAAASAAPPRPFLIAHAQCKADPAAKAAAIARAVPAAQQLPPSGLADVITTLATHDRDASLLGVIAGRGGHDGLRVHDDLPGAGRKPLEHGQGDDAVAEHGAG
ncbi:hypothetical protein EBR04_08960 [bacterium]|nr:hypothetical protein [bacterium]